VKFGTTVQLSEAAALRYVSENSLIPVPQVYCAFRKDGVTYILMTRIDGEEIGLNWAKRSDGEKEQLVTQLKNIFEELRSMPHPRPGVIAAADMQALYDPRTWKGRLGFGPFANERDFTKFLRCGVHAEDDMLNKEFNSWVTDDERAEIGKMVALQDSKEHAICFTHGDISSSNILVKDGKVVALLDFELAGFYPEYWEYTTAIDVNPYDGFWEFEIPKFLKEYPEELEMETLRKKHFG
ncbi:kinase-like protein, partial [Acephala macrosclerotiorum]